MDTELLSALFSPIFCRLRNGSYWESADWCVDAPLWEDLQTLWNCGQACKETRTFLTAYPEFHALRLAMWQYSCVADPGWVDMVAFVRDGWVRNFAAFNTPAVDAVELGDLELEDLAAVRDALEEDKAYTNKKQVW